LSASSACSACSALFSSRSFQPPARRPRNSCTRREGKASAMPIRRYLRVSKYTVLETRIYLENPGLLNTWFLHPRDPVLPRVKGAVVKDVVTGDGFEVVMFMTEGGTRHAVLSKTRLFSKKEKAGKVKANSARLAGLSGEGVGEGEGEGGLYTGDDEVVVRRESDEEEEEVELGDIPMAGGGDGVEARDGSGRRRSRRNRSARGGGGRGGGGDEDDAFVVDSDDSGDGDGGEGGEIGGRDEDGDNKKPLTRTTYDGFTIFSKALCLIVKRTDGGGRRTGGGGESTTTSTRSTRVEVLAEEVGGGGGGGGARGEGRGGAKGGKDGKDVGGAPGLMEEWITMTQVSRRDRELGE
ncbi:hypothetical protein DFH27DRAFT_629401, partial [Peziza echinospora]